MLKKVLNYYSRKEIQDAILKVCEEREVVGVYEDGRFSSRPGVLQYKNDMLVMVKSGVVEFHGSLERWKNPKLLGSVDESELRKGWDLVIDLDCKITDHGKIAAKIVSKLIKKHGIKNFYVKFTGGTGFHVAVPFETFPKEIDYSPIERLYPEVARKIIIYLKNCMREELEKELLKNYSIEELARLANVELNELITRDGINPFKIVEIDPVLISPRHLFRLPYSINRKTLLVSVPVKVGDIDEFSRSLADPDMVKPTLSFLERKGEENEAEMLFLNAVESVRETLSEKKRKEVDEVTFKVAGKNFPPCIKTILDGLSDGRKRAVFILIDFLRSLNYSWEEVEHIIFKWNKKNKPPLKESYVRGQIKYQRRRNKKIPPPNCTTQGWYVDMGVCAPDELCRRIKNPISYAIKKTLSGKRKKEKRNL